jgi:hypothetical protein
VIEIPPRGSFADDAERMSIAIAELRIAILETIEDSVKPMIPVINRLYYVLFPRRWPRRSIKKWRKR